MRQRGSSQAQRVCPLGLHRTLTPQILVGSSAIRVGKAVPVGEPGVDDAAMPRPQAFSARATPASHIGACKAAPTSRNWCGRLVAGSKLGAASQSSQAISCCSAASNSVSSSGSAQCRSSWPDTQACAGWLTASVSEERSTKSTVVSRAKCASLAGRTGRAT